MKKPVYLPGSLNLDIPGRIFEELFEASSLNEWRYNLWLWVNTVMTADFNWSCKVFSGSPANLLYNHAYITRLIEFAWEFRLPREIPQLDEAECKQLIQHAIFIPVKPRLCDVNDCIITIHYLDSEEWRNPRLAFGKAFMVYSLTCWHEILFYWLQYGLSHTSMIGNKYCDSNLYIYTQLNKLVEAAFLLNQRGLHEY